MDGGGRPHRAPQSAERPEFELNRLRNRLIAVFLAATLVPLAATVWITRSLLEHSLTLAATEEVDELSKSLQGSGRALYENACDALRAQVAAGMLRPQIYTDSARVKWPEGVKAFAASGELERFHLMGVEQDQLDFLVRRGSDILVYTKPVGGPGMRKLAGDYTRARTLVSAASLRDFRKGYTYTFIILSASVWVIALIVLVYWAARISKPIHELTAGLSELAAGNLGARVQPRGRDEVGAAMEAFNRTAEQLQQSQERLVHVGRRWPARWRMRLRTRSPPSGLPWRSCWRARTATGMTGSWSRLRKLWRTKSVRWKGESARSRISPRSRRCG
jgi:nitrogen fixation/metabolism regulation signal transduction histidine kinase